MVFKMKCVICEFEIEKNKKCFYVMEGKLMGDDFKRNFFGESYCFCEECMRMRLT